MNFKEKASALYRRVDDKVLEQSGFRIKDATFTKIVNYLHVPKDASSLAATRILFGFCMLLDIPDERGGANMDSRWGQPHVCHFPLFPFVTALPLPYMAVIYALLWIGALGITVGYKYRTSCVLFITCYWYLFLIEKSFWNNHSYLFGLVGILMSFTQANCYWSIDAYLTPALYSSTVPYWNYFILKYQFFILYFMAGLKKGTAEWLEGYSVQKLAEHWVFDLFKWFLTVQQIDYLIVHCFIFAFDLTVALWMMWRRTRTVAMLLCAMFHLMNSRLFAIGMFPWVCLATMPLFYPFDWPKGLVRFSTNTIDIIISAFTFQRYCDCSDEIIYVYENSDSTYEERLPLIENEETCEPADESNENNQELIEDKDEDKYMNADKDVASQNENPETNYTDDEKTTKEMIKAVNEYVEKAKDKNKANMIDASPRKKLTGVMILLFVILQAFLPYSHFITKGYNNWTEGLYGYSWDMMVHSWEYHPALVTVVDNDRGEQFHVDPLYYTVNERWTRHGDMVYQYARCLEKVLKEYSEDTPIVSPNISIYVDIWYSLNGRFTQRMFDPMTDILTAEWSPWKPIPYLMPLLDEALNWRSVIDQLKMEVAMWNNWTDLVFFADFPGYAQEKFISEDLQNVTLTILDGKAGFQTENEKSYPMYRGNRVQIPSGTFHTVLNIDTKPIYYMYTFTNTTEMYMDHVSKPKLPIAKELYGWFEKMCKFANLVLHYVSYWFSSYQCTQID